MREKVVEQHVSFKTIMKNKTLEQFFNPEKEGEKDREEDSNKQADEKLVTKNEWLGERRAIIESKQGAKQESKRGLR